MVPAKVFRSGSLQASVLAPGIFRVERSGADGKECLTIDANTEHALWQETGKGAGSQKDEGVTLGMTRPYHLFRQADLEKPSSQLDLFQNVKTLDERAGELFRQGREFLKQYSVIVGPDSVVQGRFKSFLKGLGGRGKIHPFDVKAGDCIALLMGKKGERALLLKVFKVEDKSGEDETPSRTITFEGVSVTCKEGAPLSITYMPNSTFGSDRPLYADDAVIPIHPDEMRQFYIPDSLARTESVEYFEKASGRDDASDRAPRSILLDYLKDRNTTSLGSVAV